MIDRKDIEKLRRFSQGNIGAEEERYIYSLFAEYENNQEFENKLEEEFNEYLKTHLDENHNLSYLLDRIHHIIHMKDCKKKDTVVKRVYKWYSIAAATLLIPIIIAGGLWFMNSQQDLLYVAEAPVKSVLYAPLGSRVSFALPDGTQGWLNSGSSLKYSLPFKSNRQIELAGEAWFDVAHDEEHPFEISISSSKVKVLGTQFNLSAYPDENYIEVVLEDGKVEFTTPGLESGIVMKPNERLVFNDGAIKINKTDAEKYAAWKEGKLVFRGDTMDEVARRIGRWYNVHVELVDDELMKYSIRGIFQDDSLEEVIQYLSMTSPIRYRIIERKQLADGTIQSKKVLLYKKNM